MAKLDRLPDSATIIAARKRVDFYLWKGIPVARAWPRRSSQPRSAGEIASSNAFVASVKLTGAIDPHVQAAFKRQMMGVGVGVTWVDFQRAMSRGKPWISSYGS